MESTKAKNAYDRYKQIVDLLTNARDARGLKLVAELVEKCANYVEVAANAEAAGRMQHFRQQTDEQEIEKLESLDKLRHIVHNALIDQLNIVNRYVMKKKEELGWDIPPGGIYSEDPSTIKARTAVGDWAGALVEALYKRQIIKKPASAE